MEERSKERLEYLYKEYARLSDRAEEFAKSTIDDFKLFGVVGVFIVIWKPATDFVLATTSKIDSSLILFLGFLSLYIILGIIALLNLFKQAYVWYYIHNLKAYEAEIRKELEESEASEVFSFSAGKEQSRFVASYRLTYGSFLLAIAFAAIVLPFIVLCYSNIFYAVVYLLIAVSSFFVIYVQVFRRMIKQYSKTKFL